jgi:NADH-quinone oxidoreductase subunit N
VGLTAASEAGVNGVLFYLFGYAFMNVAAFAVIIGVGQLVSPKKGESLDDILGLGGRKPGLALVFTLVLLSLAGIPPLVGFMAKLYVFSSAVQAGLSWLAIVGVINSVVSAYYYLRVVIYMYLKESEAPSAEGGALSLALQIGLVVASVAVVVLGLWPTPILDLARVAAGALLGG